LATAHVLSPQARHPETPELLDKYLSEIGRTGLLTAEEEVELSDRARAGDERARKRLIEKNLRLVVSVAKKYRGYPSRTSSRRAT
jgi:RNA polymerase primary sigma factor